MEVTGKTSLLPRDLRNVLAQVDGKATVGDLHQKLDKFSEAKLFDTLGKLVKDGFVREFVSAPASVSPPSATPRLAVTRRGPSAVATGVCAMVARMSSATTAAWAREVPGSSTTNSAPPSGS